ncbi:MAG: hypothetical protein HY332_25230 [Chloroflexi bacterium]|nr:hypothetical protein [Chloroflexota bacterium]
MSETAGSEELRPIPKEVDDAIRGVATAESPEHAALTLAAIANRAVAELNKLARAEGARRRGQPDWGDWAGLANTARDAVLKTATCRKTAADLARKAREGEA